MDSASRQALEIKSNYYRSENPPEPAEAKPSLAAPKRPGEIDLLEESQTEPRVAAGSPPVEILHDDEDERSEVTKPVSSKRSYDFSPDALIGVDPDDFPPGRFEFTENIHLRWAKPDWFELRPYATAPFRFVRANGSIIQPGRMFTDGGSVPRLARSVKSLSPWGFAPAYLIHDWEFDLHHGGVSQKSFEDVRDTMLEAINTMAAAGMADVGWAVFNAVYWAVNSSYAREIWQRKADLSPLPAQPVA